MGAVAIESDALLLAGRPAHFRAVWCFFSDFGFFLGFGGFGCLGFGFIEIGVTQNQGSRLAFAIALGGRPRWVGERRGLGDIAALDVAMVHGIHGVEHLVFEIV